MTSYLSSLRVPWSQPAPVASTSASKAPVPATSYDKDLAELASMPPPTFSFASAEPDDDAHHSDENEDQRDDDGAAPSFPAANSAQRLATPSSTTTLIKARKKVALAPGYSQLDWAKVKASGRDKEGNDLRVRFISAV